MTAASHVGSLLFGGNGCAHSFRHGGKHVTIGPQLISAKVHEGILEKADRLFRNDDAGVWIELLQNARRAGATRVHISFEESGDEPGFCKVTIQDNGTGIEDFQSLLSLGASGWNEATQAKEDPAGMGFFSLCRSEVKVQSVNQSVIISPTVFLGKDAAEVRQTSEYVQGTRIRFTRESAKGALLSALENVAEFCPVAVFIADRELPQHDFLDGALYRETIDGIEVGFATNFTYRYNTFRDPNWNFYGARLHHSVTPIQGFLPAGTISPVALHMRFTVLQTSRVKLQLPDRRAIIEDEFLTSFLSKARVVAYRFFQKQERHALPFRNWREAKELGVSLPEAACLLYTWHATPLDDGIEPLFGYPEHGLLDSCDDVILVTANVPDEHTIEAALHSGASLPGKLYKEEAQSAGYSWYDRLPQIVDSAVFLDGIPYEEWTKPEEDRPQRIEIEITLAEAGKSPRQLRLPALIHVDPSDGCSFVAVRQSSWDNDDLAGPFSVTDFLVCATFCASDDWGESDSWQTQKDAYDEDIERRVNAYFRGPKATLMAILRTAIEWEVDRLAEQLGVVEIRFTRSTAHVWNAELIHSQAPLLPQV
jgi:anti-sigma regulatory factor (Ser/Thr protein kinase)